MKDKVKIASISQLIMMLKIGDPLAINYYQVIAGKTYKLSITEILRTPLGELFDKINAEQLWYIHNVK